ncbi:MULTISPECIES: YncE family protein [Streptomyces]|jgi:DNA-binding beta-propeller fold protein YncE|uniref:DNA-binding beta-propeller fold protein YncE n=1 Tax=Streptomyces thermodiastaticus TaxID=44061 RepID=A0ABU0KRK2_9ACTN|nr:PQQ-binding-like beta-propeller repeat protein [Streptomyces sp. McG7]MBT2902917.1 PQQ-binding-like beta-propeller repeat protein [Streptomyces sp. McG8]MDQ0491036.1 DNA-binding beta-propeller fold protein YncE [Streptomyces thermodiastaticus]MDX3413455.1 PQQ-binding-like beta-propeller repeat protein [Streptomyces sp. MD20-1-1]MXQ61290.1 PQQ-binding-like beta-propeller repeat protein [Streptomyces sp. XHT-2]THC58861.1 YncE family protein [Streptomyces sp. Akac8]UVT13252.1 PQQ-binding-like
MPIRSRHLCTLAAVVLTLTAPGAVASAAGQTSSEDLREVLFVGNNWDGTADVIESGGDFGRVGRINVIPDKDRRMAEINANPIRWIYFMGIRNTVGEGHDQFVDDMYSTPDGTAVVVSRPSFADVVSLDLATGRVNWRFPVSGYRSDHMAVSPDGRRVAVSASTSNTVHVLDIETGEEVGRFKTGDKPHENVFTRDGRYIWNMSIGEVNNDLDAPWLDFTKGDRRITVADARTFEQVRVIDMRERLDAAGFTGYSDAVRPAAFSPDESKLYFQVSFFNGFFEYDVATDRISRVKTLPKNPATSEDRTTWVNDSRHHGITMKPDGAKLCVAGTMDDYATVVDRDTFEHGPLVPVAKPYWATVSGDGESCVVSESGADQVTAIDFATGEKTVSVPVGDHPQRVRLGHVREGWTGPSGG